MTAHSSVMPILKGDKLTQVPFSSNTCFAYRRDLRKPLIVMAFPNGRHFRTIWKLNELLGWNKCFADATAPRLWKQQFLVVFQLHFESQVGTYYGPLLLDELYGLSKGPLVLLDEVGDDYGG